MGSGRVVWCCMLVMCVAGCRAARDTSAVPAPAVSTSGAPSAPVVEDAKADAAPQAAQTDAAPVVERPALGPHRVGLARLAQAASGWRASDEEGNQVGELLLSVEEVHYTQKQSRDLYGMSEELLEKPLPLDAPHVPGWLRAPQRLTLITERGPIHTTPSRAVIIEDSDEYRNVYRAFDYPAGLDGLSLGMFAVPYDEALPSGARVRAGQAVSVSGPAGGAITKHVRAELAAQLKATRARNDKATVKKLRPAEDIQIVRGRFGGDKTLLVTYTVEREPGDGEDWGDLYSGMFLTDDAGEGFVRVLDPQSLSSARVEELVDLDGDGVDEVSFSLLTEYGEFSRHICLLFLEDGQYDFVVLSGYGGDGDEGDDDE